MSTIQVLVVFPNIAPADLADFRQRAAELLEISIPEERTLHYDWFFADDETRCAVHEVYADSDAMLEHLGRVGHLIGPLVELGGGLEPTIFGAMSPELAAAVASFHATEYTRFQGK
jgi:quinol monooxygenase YgiN